MYSHKQGGKQNPYITLISNNSFNVINLSKVFLTNNDPKKQSKFWCVLFLDMM